MRSHYCGDLDASQVDREVEICGWVHRRRDHGGVIFLDVRDRSGIVQVVYDPDIEDSFATADKVRSEYVLRITGRVRRRPAGTVNPDMQTGEIEVLGRDTRDPEHVVDATVPARRLLRCRRRHPSALSLSRSASTRNAASAADARDDPVGGAVHLETPDTPKSKRRFSRAQPRKARATISCRAARIRVSSSRCRNRRRCSSSC